MKSLPLGLSPRLLWKLAVISALAAAAAKARAATYYATNNVTAYSAESGGVVNGDGSSGNPWSPNYAFTRLTAGDTLVLKGAASGLTVYTNQLGTWPNQYTYWGSGTFGSGITIRSETAAGVIIRPAGGSNPALFIGSPDSQSGHEAKYLTFDGLRFDGTNCGTTTTGVPVVKIDFGSFITFTNCEFYNSPGAHGILIADADAHNITLTHCTIYSNAVNTANSQPPHGVYMSGNTYSNTVEYCTIYGHTNTLGGSITPLGIHIYGGGTSGNSDVIRYNYLHDNNKGIGIYSGTNHLVYGNLIDNSGTGAIMGIQIQAPQSKYFNNTVVSGGSSSALNYGLNVLGATTAGNLIWNNIIVSNRYDGLLINSGTPANYFTNNLIADNASVGGANYTDSSGVQVTSGNLVGNVYDASLTASPNFVPQSTSSARNAGIEYASYTVDRLGVTVPTESVTDIGAAEYSSGGTTPTVSVTSNGDAQEAVSPVASYFVFSRTSTSGSTTNGITLSGTAVSGTDYVAFASTNVVIGAGNSTTNLIVTPINNALVDGTRTLTVTITSTSGTIGSPAAATMNILDDDRSRTKQRIKY